MNEIDVGKLKKAIKAHKQYRIAQVAAYYGDESLEDINVSECTSMDRLLSIAQATGAQVRIGMRDEDGSILSRAVDFDGCTFWAPVYDKRYVSFA